MTRFLPLFACCLLSCNATTTSPPVRPTLDVTICDPMYRIVTCRLKDDQRVWYKYGMPKDFVVHARKKSTVQYVTSSTETVSACVYLDKYTPQELDAPAEEVSFFHVEHSRKGVMDKRLALLDECTFWLQKTDDADVLAHGVRNGLTTGVSRRALRPVRFDTLALHVVNFPSRIPQGYRSCHWPELDPMRMQL